MSVCAPCAHLVPTDVRKGCVESLELELQTVVSQHVGTGTQTHFFCYRTKWS